MREAACLGALSFSISGALNLMVDFSYAIVEPQAELGKTKALSTVMSLVLGCFCEMFHFSLYWSACISNRNVDLSVLWDALRLQSCVNYVLLELTGKRR